MRQPNRCVRAVCKCVALLPSRNITCVRPPSTARPRRLSSHFTVPSSHPALRKPHSSHLKPHFSKSLHTATFCTEKLLHTEARSFCTQKLFLHCVATSMQPLQCLLQPHVSNLPLSTHMATQHGNIHAAIPLQRTSHSTLHLPCIKCNAHRTPPFDKSHP